jgi:aminoglycoside phosphotransferase (APT) family kinase protein
MVLTRGGESDLRLAAEWLTRFHLQTILGREPWNGSRLADAFAAWGDRIGTTMAEAALFDRALARSRELDGVPFPIVWQHRDFTPWNLLRNGKGRLSVLDWEGAQPGPALCDLLHFVSHWDELAAGAVAPEERLRAFSMGAAASRREVTRYCERLGIDLRFIPLMLVFTRIEIALRDPERTIDARYVAALADRAGDLFPVEPLHAT